MIILIGTPGSGKSTWAKDYITKQKALGIEYVRINRDDFRLMLKNQQLCESKVETLINELQDQAIITALNSKFNVIIDNTNLKESYLTHFTDLVQYKADVEFKLIDVGLKKAIEQDALRPNPVGAIVVKKMNANLEFLKTNYTFTNQKKKSLIYKHPKLDENLQNCYIFDLDGTMAHHQNKRNVFDWMKVDLDEVDELLAAINNIIYLSKSAKIFFVSGRSEVCRDLTIQWLKKHNIYYDDIFMRSEKDQRKDIIIKEEIYNNHFKGQYNILGVFDDRKQVVNTWRKLGVKCFQVEDNDF